MITDCLLSYQRLPSLERGVYLVLLAMLLENAYYGSFSNIYVGMTNIYKVLERT